MSALSIDMSDREPCTVMPDPAPTRRQAPKAILEAKQKSRELWAQADELTEQEMFAQAREVMVNANIVDQWVWDAVDSFDHDPALWWQAEDAADYQDTIAAVVADMH